MHGNHSHGHGHGHGDATPKSNHVDPERFREGQRITWVSVGVNVVLTAMQVIVGLLAHSVALVADAMHTLSDIVADAFVLYANRKGAEAADDEHPYGHGRIETAASLLLGVVLAVTGGGILVSAAGRLQDLGGLPPVGAAAIWAAIATLLAKEGLFRYMLRVAERLRSPMLVANAWHARADALSSLVVAVGVGGSLLGFPFADAVAAIVVGAMIVKAGVGFAWDAMQELIDTGLSAEEVASIKATIAATRGVVDLHELRTRRMAHQVLVDAHIQVDGRISVSEGHRIAETARDRVLKDHPEVLDVLVHVDAEKDLDPARGARQLPERAVLLSHLGQMLGEDVPPPERVVLHYLGNRVEAEVTLPPGSADVAASCQRRLSGNIRSDPWFAAVTVLQRVAPK
ncbi:MAG: cation diffusion facilitator family transporter [Gammaproteobacteria bacterium]|nr:cation diffusion facilitator family transporter [Gammaproteobacteria bacterium]MBU1645343.1 cation diffusion facilitator family transporter [Gammaproteobacteria bacterium]MBU1972336.1 cation diffusion facilitator family transporter [Gammaproteobacteria bacterium]